MPHKFFSEKLLFLSFFVLFASFTFTNFAIASETNGTIDNESKYAWGENIGWINFGCDSCNVTVTDSRLSGKAWSSQYGWINLNPDNSGVSNTSEGVLSGFAWSSNLGWINFTGVTINTASEFSGYATLESDNSQINFNCAGIVNSCSTADFKVKTDWRPASMRQSETNGGSGSSGYRPPPNLPPSTTPPPTTPPILPPYITTPFTNVVNNISTTINSIYNSLLSFFKPEKPEKIIVEIPKITPLAFQIKWNLLPVEEIRSFVFAPLPYEIQILANKFPELDNTFKSVGIERMTDISKLTGVNLNLPGLTDTLNTTIKNISIEELTAIKNISGVSLNIPGLSDFEGKITSNIGTGKISLIKGLPIADFPLSAKKNLPTEFVFARGAGELVDYNVALSVGEKGEVTQKISSLPGKILKLVVKPISSARSVTGYFVFKSATPKISKENPQIEISRASLTASVLFSMNDLVEDASTYIPIEKKLVLSSFEYTDPDKDGIYTADVVSPLVPGEYEIITVIDYIDPVLGSRKMSMITVIDPEGYVYEENNGKETRIPSAIVSLYVLNTTTKKYELWDAKNYNQDNPQITDVRGTYSFLVPEGSYYFQVEAPGYKPYEGKVFLVIEGSGIHQNIELNSGIPFLFDIDPQTILLIVVLLLLVYNLYRNTLRDKLLRFLNKNDGK